MTLEEEYRLLAMRADKRLQRLEKYAKRPENKDILKGAYARAQRDIKAWRGAGHTRFGIKPPSDPFQLKAQLNDLKAFLRADTSTLKPGKETRGYSISVYKKQAQTFNKRFGTNFTWNEINNYYGSKIAQKIAKNIKASKTVARALGEFKELSQKNPKISGAQLRRDIQNNPNITLSDDAVVNEVMKKMIKLGLSPRTMFK